ncbi:PREDICTED: LOW QUALITY PROTEIN: UDP-glucuronosyltransferase 2A1-like [Branchiostoma belcheri]|uniref:LOW QUALITY PROTEIN: UDP-glucuronosyltransferase 2A1-like n=1 Tax=Branchiostoma belcheri TaxID=7741 RepID=A0A6P5AW74_BRABE|nr:PREDICTED: LOW QUALITY PROTEIN: UDP-glucuronosyltransferase 2A1-like [Branchiostoma belcheri]
METGTQYVVLCMMIYVILTVHRIGAEKVLVVPPAVGGSHWFPLASVGQALAGRGHDVTVVVSQDIVDKRRADRPELRFESFFDQGSQGMNFMAEHCDLLMANANLMGRLKQARFRVVVSQPFFSQCGAIVAAHLGVPHVALLRGDLSGLNSFATGVPRPPSYVPYILSSFTDRMTFSQRVQNLVVSCSAPVVFQWIVGRINIDLVKKYLGEEETLVGVLAKTDVWLYQTDVLLDLPSPRMPNMVDVGGINSQAANSLSEDLELFMQSSGSAGVVVVSFGSQVKTINLERAEVMAAAFAQLRQKVVWRYTGEKPAGLGNNTKLMSWLPQNDLLGHPKSKASFVTHTGSNGMYEALYHGVPMVCLPLIGDQPGNAARVVSRGLGVRLDFNTFTTETLYHAIMQVLAKKSYRETAARLSRLHRDQPQSPMERAVWWIEHVIKHGGLPHLRARAVELPWYQYYLLDVAAFLLAVCSAVLVLIWCSCFLVCRKICRKSGDKLKSQ